MNRELQFRFEEQMLENNIVKDLKLFNKHSDGVYKHDLIWHMYRVWVNQEAKYEVIICKLEKQIEESFMLGYTDAENDFRLSRGE